MRLDLISVTLFMLLHKLVFHVLSGARGFRLE